MRTGKLLVAMLMTSVMLAADMYRRTADSEQDWRKERILVCGG